MCRNLHLVNFYLSKFQSSTRRRVYIILNLHIYIRLRKTLNLAVCVPAAPFRSRARVKVRNRSLADGQMRSPRTRTILTCVSFVINADRWIYGSKFWRSFRCHVTICDADCVHAERICIPGDELF
jgi:hypothetical protein